MTRDRIALVNQQVIRYTLEHEAAARRSDDREVFVKPVITVSRQFGSGGTEIARAVAHRLGYPLFDREIIEDVSRQAGIHESILNALDERTRKRIEQWVDGVLHQSILSADEFITALGKTVITLSRMGSAVLIGRGTNFFLQGEPVLNVRVVAGTASRILNVMEQTGASREEAAERVHTVDRERRRFVEKYLHRDIDEPTAYDLVLNTSHLDREHCVRLIHETYEQVVSRVAAVNTPADHVV